MNTEIPAIEVGVHEAVGEEQLTEILLGMEEEGVPAHVWRDGELNPLTLADRRRDQQKAWLWNMVRDELMESLNTSAAVREAGLKAEAALDDEALSALEGAADILRAFASDVPTMGWAR